MQSNRASHVLGIRRIKRAGMLRNSYNIRTGIFFEKWLAWLSYLALKSESKGSLVMSMLVAVGIRIETEHDYLLLPSIFQASSVHNLPLQPRNKSTLSTSGQEILQKLNQLNNYDQG